TREPRRSHVQHTRAHTIVVVLTSLSSIEKEPGILQQVFHCDHAQLGGSVNVTDNQMQILDHERVQMSFACVRPVPMHVRNAKRGFKEVTDERAIKDCKSIIFK